MLTPETPANAEVAPARAVAAPAGRTGGNAASKAGPPGRSSAAKDGVKRRPAGEKSPETEAEPAPNPFFAWIARCFHKYGQLVGVFLLSVVFHSLLAILFGLIMLDPVTVEKLSTIFVSTVNEDEGAEKDLEFVDQPDVLDAEAVDTNPMEVPSEQFAETPAPAEMDISDLAPSLKVKNTSSIAPNVKIDLNSDLAGRSKAARSAMLRQFGVEDSMGFAFSVVVYVVFFGFALIGGVLYGTRQFISKS